MLRTTRFLWPSVILSLTILGLAIVYNGGMLDFQFGQDQRFRIEGTHGEPKTRTGELQPKTYTH